MRAVTDNTMATYARRAYDPTMASRSLSRPLKTLLIVFAVCIGVGIVGVAGLVWKLSAASEPEDSAFEPFDLSSIEPAPLPELGAGEDRGAYRFFDLRFGGEGLAGHGARAWLYLPAGEHAPGSLPCVMIAPAGASLLSGMALAPGDSDEHTPYAEAGFAVLAFALDGPAPDDPEDIAAQRDAYQAFGRALQGLVNGRNALELVLEKVPAVDPKRIYAAGHSSAGTFALLWAAHEPRLAGVVAFAPALDRDMRGAEPMELSALDLVFPRIIDHSIRGDPDTHAARIRMPTFLFHAEDDGTVDIAHTRAFADTLRSHGVKVAVEVVPEGGHYLPMLDPGIPRAIEWITAQSASP